MYYSQFEVVCKNLFGRSWKSQVADYFMIDRRRVNDWSKRGGELPEFVKNELSTLIERRTKEVNHARKMFNGFDYHLNAIFSGETHHLNQELITIDDIKEFINNQMWRVKENAKVQKSEGVDISEIIEDIENDFLSENDISGWCNQHDLFLDHLDEIKELRADACLDVKLSIS